MQNQKFICTCVYRFLILPTYMHASKLKNEDILKLIFLWTSWKHINKIIRTMNVLIFVYIFSFLKPLNF